MPAVYGQIGEIEYGICYHKSKQPPEKSVQKSRLYFADRMKEGMEEEAHKDGDGNPPKERGKK